MLIIRIQLNQNNSIDTKNVLVVELLLPKSARIRSFSGPYFPAFGLNTNLYPVYLPIQSKCVKMRTIKAPNMGTFHAVFLTALDLPFGLIIHIKATFSQNIMLKPPKESFTSKRNHTAKIRVIII